MNKTASRAFSLTTLRAVVVLPGACMEGALAVAVPWLVAQATLGTPWLGLASAGLVLAAMLGTLAAPALERRLGNRRMTVFTAFVVVVALALAALCWAWRLPVPAYAFALLAMAADAASDLGFASRLPLLARLSAQGLEQFSGGNWLWGIAGAAGGSVLAGWAMAADASVELAWSMVLLSLVVACGLAWLMPRGPRGPREQSAPATTQPLLAVLVSRQFWSGNAVKIALVLIAVVFFAGPIDNLLLPAHLATRHLPADTFGDMLAVMGLGLAAGLWLAQLMGSTSSAESSPASSSASSLASKRRAKVVLGLLGLAGQLGLMLWLPQPWLLLTGLFVCAACFAPVLPMLEAAMLTAAQPAQRTLMLAALSTLVGLGDVLGTVSFGAVMSWGGSALALGACLAVACAAAVVCTVWPRPVQA
jgi:MFS family permease